MSTLTLAVPAYNMAAWLPAALESCLWQTHRDVEILVVDDGSTDATPDIVDVYARADSRVRAIRQVNQGHGAARQTGQDQAQGDFITWLDADDFLPPEAAAEMLGAASRHGVDMVCGNAVVFSSETFNTRAYFPHEPAASLTFDAAPAYWKSKVLWRWIFSLPLVRALNLRHPPYKLGQDVCFMYDALTQADRFAQCGASVYYFRQEHKSAAVSLDVAIDHGLGHVPAVKDILAGRGRYKPLAKYLGENFWRDIKKLAPVLVSETAEDGPRLERVLDIALAVGVGLDPDRLTSGRLAPEASLPADFQPLLTALVAGDRDEAREFLVRLGRRTARSAVSKGDRPDDLFTVWRRRAKAFFSPRSRRTRRLLRELDRRAAERLAKAGALRQAARVA